MQQQLHWPAFAQRPWDTWSEAEVLDVMQVLKMVDNCFVGTDQQQLKL
jgi:hypothetical protein